MSTFTVFNDVFAKIDASIGIYISGTAANVISFLVPLFNSLLIIYLALWGIAHLLGQIDEPLRDGIRRIIKVVLIISFALNIGLYSGTIVNLLFGAPEQISSVVTGTAPTSAVLDNLLAKGFMLGWTTWEKGGIVSNLGMYVVALMVWIATIIVLGYAAFLLLFSKLAMAVLLALGPLFITLLLFSTTQKFFEMWLAQVVNYGFLMIFSIALTQLLLGLSESLLNSVVASSAAFGISIEDAISLVLVSVISFLILRQAPQIAMGLGGGVALATQGFVGAALRKATGINALRPSQIQRNIRRGTLGAQADYQATKGLVTAPVRATRAARRRFSGNIISGR